MTLTKEKYDEARKELSEFATGRRRWTFREHGPDAKDNQFSAVIDVWGLSDEDMQESARLLLLLFAAKYGAALSANKCNTGWFLTARVWRDMTEEERAAFEAAQPALASQGI